MIGVMAIIFVFIPESPWWLAGQEKLSQAAKVLKIYNGHIEGYNVNAVIVSFPSHICNSVHVLLHGRIASFARLPHYLLVFKCTITPTCFFVKSTRLYLSCLLYLSVLTFNHRKL